MDNNKLKNPAYLFEVSWEVCNKVGGIHTVISTKALNMEKNTAVVIFNRPRCLALYRTES